MVRLHPSLMPTAISCFFTQACCGGVPRKISECNHRAPTKLNWQAMLYRKIDRNFDEKMSLFVVVPTADINFPPRTSPCLILALLLILFIEYLFIFFNFFLSFFIYFVSFFFFFVNRICALRFGELEYVAR